MKYYLFNIGQPYDDAWWNRHLSMEVITAGFDNAEGDRGDRILNDLNEGDWVIAYANRYGAVGAGIVAPSATYRLVDSGVLPSDFESSNRHFRSVHWIHYAASLNDAVPYSELLLGAPPRNTKTEITDASNAQRIISLIAAKSVENNRGAANEPHARCNFFFYNTDANALRDDPRPRYRILIEKGFAAVGGDRQRFGEQFLQLAPNDILLMYENGIGVVAVGKVQTEWDRVAHDIPMYYTPAEMQQLTGGAHEYRIEVDWFLEPPSPIGAPELRDRFGYTPRGAVKRIVEQRTQAERIIQEFRLPPVMNSDVADLPPPDRVLTTTFRMVRDTEVIRRVKRLHRNKCQICGHTIELPNGLCYSEGHHIVPLGYGHCGLDVIENVLCVCPNHHAELDYGVSAIDPSRLRTSPSHRINPQFIAYHNEHIYKARN